jgi:HSP20 family protein
MASKQALQPTTETKAPVLVEIEKVFAQMKEATESIAHRAYEFFEARGREFGHDLEDWFRAETELMRYVPVEINDTADNLIVRAEVPGFGANDLKINIEGRQLLLSGKVETNTEEKTEQVVYNERRSQQFYRTITLPTNVDATKATTALRDGVLELTLPKVASPAAINVPINTTA